MVWHYSAWAKLPAIVKSCELRGSNVGADGEKPMLWFSANQQWEPTATKDVINNRGERVHLTFKQQADRFGCIRFGLDADDIRLMKWKVACAYAGTPRETHRTLEKVGRKEGGDPAQWFATSAFILLDELHFQLWHEGWHDTTSPQDMAEVWEAHHAGA